MSRECNAREQCEYEAGLNFDEWATNHSKKETRDGSNKVTSDIKTKSKMVQQSTETVKLNRETRSKETRVQSSDTEEHKLMHQ